MNNRRKTMENKMKKKREGDIRTKMELKKIKRFEKKCHNVCG